MFKSMGRAWRNLMVMAVLAGACGFAAQAIAQDATATNPERTIYDPLGIDIAAAAYVHPNTHLTVGDPGNGGLAWKYLPGSSSFEGFVEVGGAWSPTVVKIEGNATSFIPNGSAWQNASGTGSTLTSNASNWIYTDQQGIVYTFNQIPYNSAQNPSVEGRLLSIAKPNGEIVTLNYAASSTNNSLASVVSNRGYAIKYVWNSSFSAATIYGINLSAHTCDASLNCDGYDGYVNYSMGVSNANAPYGIADQVTDAAGNSWYYYVDFSFDYTNPRTYAETVGPLALLYYQAPSGYFAKVAYDGAGRITTFTDNRGAFNFDYNGQTVAVAHTTQGRNVTVTDPSGSVLYSAAFTYGQSILSSYQDGAGNQTTYNIASTLVQNGYYNNYYTRLMSVTKPEGNSVSYSYDARGNVIQVTDTPKSGSGLSATSIYANYDSTCLNPVKCNKPNWTQDARGNYTYYTYDPTHGGTTLVQSPADSSGATPEAVTTWAQFTAQVRNSAGAMVNSGTIWLPQSISACASAATCNGSVNQLITTTAYANYNLLPSSVTTAAGDGSASATTSYSYDNTGNVMTVDGPRTDVDDRSYNTYDALRRPVYEISVDPDGSGSLPRVMVHHIYTGVLETQTERGTGTSTTGSDFSRAAYATIGYNSAGQKIITASYINGNSTPQSLTQYNYDVRGRANCVAVRMNPNVYGSIASTDACTLGTTGSFGSDRITKTTYNNGDHVTEVDQAYGVSGTQRAYVRYTYNANGTKQTEMDANGNKTMFIYDGFDRISQIQYPSTTAGSGGVNTADYETFGYDASSNKTTWRRRNGKIFYYNYDNLNREILHYVSDGSVPNVYSGYDLRNDVLYVRYSSTSGAGIINTFDGLGRLASTTDMNGRTLWYSYNQASARTQLTYPDLNAVGYTLDAANRLTAFGWNASSGWFSQSYDGLGRIYVQGKAGGATTFVTDNLGRLSSLTNDLNGTAYDVAWNFTYNPAGQIYQTTASSSVYDYKETANTTFNQAYDGLNRDAGIAALSGGYDANGNLSNDGARSMTYDAYNHLVTLVGGGANLSLVYDPIGRLAKYSTDGGSTFKTFLYDMSDLVGEYDTGGNLSERYIHGGGTDNPLMWLHGSGATDLRWFYTDYHGSIIGYSDGSGNLVDLYKYGPYGEPRNASNGASWTGSRFKYTGQIMLPEAQLYYYKARVYDPNWGHFLQTDPIGSAGDEDLYAYTGDDAVNATDPTGLIENSGSSFGGGSSAENQKKEEEHKAFCLQNPDKCPGEIIGLGDTKDGKGFKFVKITDDGREILGVVDKGTTEPAVLGPDDLIGVADGATEVKIGVFVTEEGSKLVAKEASEVAEEVLSHVCCFVAGTPVATQSGLRPIEQIKVGDLVLSKDPKTGVTAYKPVAAIVPRHDRDIFEVRFTVALADGTVRPDRIKTTADHPWRTADGRWTETAKLTPGELVQTAYGASVAVQAVRDTKHAAPTYNLEVADFHTYFVGENRIWVHNSCAVPLTEIGRSLAKKFGRPGSAFAEVKGGPETINKAAQEIYDQILKEGEEVFRHHARFGDVKEVKLPGVGGVRFSANGKFIGFLEP